MIKTFYGWGKANFTFKSYSVLLIQFERNNILLFLPT